MFWQILSLSLYIPVLTDWQDQIENCQSVFAFTLGWLNKFRISPSFDFNIELKGLIAPSRVSPVAMDGSYLFGFSATV